MITLRTTDQRHKLNQDMQNKNKDQNKSNAK